MENNDLRFNSYLTNDELINMIYITKLIMIELLQYMIEKPKNQK